MKMSITSSQSENEEDGEIFEYLAKGHSGRIFNAINQFFHQEVRLTLHH